MERASRKTESLCVTEKNKVSSARAENTGRKTGAPQPGPGAPALRSASPVTQACRRRPVRPRRESGESPSGRRPPLRAPPPDPASARTCALRAPRACSGCLQSGSFLTRLTARRPGVLLEEPVLWGRASGGGTGAHVPALSLPSPDRERVVPLRRASVSPSLK